MLTENDVEFTREEAAAYLKRKPATLRNWATIGLLLPDSRIRGRPLYLKSSLDQWKVQNAEAVSKSATAESQVGQEGVSL